MDKKYCGFCKSKGYVIHLNKDISRGCNFVYVGEGREGEREWRVQIQGCETFRSTKTFGFQQLSCFRQFGTGVEMS